MIKKALYKVPNGKLLKIFLEEAGGKIASLKITGDFFMYPEENIEKIEQSLAGCELNEAALTSRLHECEKNYPTKLFGLDHVSLVSTILTAYRS